jgi:Zn finger protein HypA/HybF involved in hydrogenase expression
MDKLATHSMLVNTDLTKGYCKCKKCGRRAEVDTSIVLTSYPPQYNYHCPHCGEHGFILCSEAYYETKSFDNLEKLPELSSQLAVSCLICGEPVPSNTLNYEAAVCEKCKKAILKLRKMLED